MAQHFVRTVPLRRVLLQHRADEAREGGGRLNGTGIVVGGEGGRLALDGADQNLHRLELR